MDAHEALKKTREAKTPVVLQKVAEIEKQILEAVAKGLYFVKATFDGFDAFQIGLIKEHFTRQCFAWDYFSPDTSSDYVEISWERPVAKPASPSWSKTWAWLERDDL